MDYRIAGMSGISGNDTTKNCEIDSFSILMKFAILNAKFGFSNRNLIATFFTTLSHFFNYFLPIAFLIDGPETELDNTLDCSGLRMGTQSGWNAELSKVKLQKRKDAKSI